MENESKLGMNRTGIQMAPIEGPNQVEFAESQPTGPQGSGPGALAAARAAYIQDGTRIGSVPLPATGKGVVQATVGKLTGKHPEVLLDKLGQRLAFERSGVRFYQAMIAKVEAAGEAHRDALRTDLLHICSEEAEHFRMLTDVVTKMGADPTAMTPSADVSGVSAIGLLQVVTDHRTTVVQSLEAILALELTDTASWELLIDLVTQSGQDDLVGRFRKALAAEQEHVAMITKWVRELTMEAAT